MKVKLALDEMTLGQKLELILKKQDVEGLKDFIYSIAAQDELIEPELEYFMKENELDIVEIA